MSTQDRNGQQLYAGYPVRTQRVTPGVLTSVLSGLLGDDTVSVILTADTTCFVRLGPDTTVVSVANGTSDHRMVPNVPVMFNTKSARYLAVIGGGGSLYVTEINN